jgi:hypothetical protein
MNDVLISVLAEQVQELANANKMLAVSEGRDFEPLSNNYHSVVNHVDLGTQNVFPFFNYQLFVGEIELIYIGTVQPAVLPIPLFFNHQGSEQNTNGDHTLPEQTEKGWKFTGIFGGLYIISQAAGQKWHLEYRGYLIKMN